jgi:hypothetical protein
MLVCIPTSVIAAPDGLIRADAGQHKTRGAIDGPVSALGRIRKAHDPFQVRIALPQQAHRDAQRAALGITRQVFRERHPVQFQEPVPERARDQT